MWPFTRTVKSQLKEERNLYSALFIRYKEQKTELKTLRKLITVRYLLRVRYNDGMTYSDIFLTKEAVLSQIADRLVNNEEHKNVQWWKIEVIPNG